MDDLVEKSINDYIFNLKSLIFSLTLKSVNNKNEVYLKIVDNLSFIEDLLKVGLKEKTTKVNVENIFFEKYSLN